ncbi:MAG TPA: lysylphosphatidylglycerol synthase transmembrane domain-containing protein [Verrucomicrobiae bacterium]|nr:lysylphosphatidylglycerol synthase transmembrane domain-containing protein [Verrucomicrobiae bacterium]
MCWRLILCALLLGWILHSIFVNEGKAEAQRLGLNWEALPRLEQWRMAWTQGPMDLWRTICLVHPSALAASLVLMCLTIILGVARWRMTLERQGLPLPWRRALSISFVAHFFNSFLLGSTGGDLIKAYYAARETHHKKTEAVVTVFVDRLIGLWALLLFAAVMMIPNFDLVRTHKGLAYPALMILAMLGGSTVVLSVAFWGGVSKRFPRARMYLRRLPKGEYLERSLDSCRRFGDAGFLLKMVGVSVAVNTVWVFQVMTLAAGLDLQVPSIALFVIVPTIFCISALPITPSGLGVRENLFVIMLATLGVARKSSLSLSLLAYAASLFWSMVGGVVYAGLREKEHLAEVRQETVAEAESGERAAD